jgi:alkylhydroperoxidase family enzyme
MPDRLYLLDRRGRVVYKSGRGPFGFKPGELEQAIVMSRLDQSDHPRVHQSEGASGDAGAKKRTSARFPVADDAAAWAVLPAAEVGAGQPLPSWARILAPAMPRTTAAVLELDYVQRTRSPLDPRERALLRYVAARANGCAASQAIARADFMRAGGTPARLDRIDRNEYEGDEAAPVEFIRKLTLAADTITDAEVQELLERYGEKQLTGMVLLAAYANFQDRLFLSLGIEPGDETDRPPLEVRFRADGGGAGAAPPRTRPVDLPAPDSVPDQVHDPSWREMNWAEIETKLESQKGRSSRIRIPSWQEVLAGLPAGVPRPAKPVRIQWSLVTMGYAPELAAAWSRCTRTFMEETRQDRVFEESLFWVVTRTIHCFY